MNKILKDLPLTIAYLYDIIIYSKTAEEHLGHLQQVFQKFAKEIQYLGHVLSTTGIKPLPSKMAAIKLMKPPKNTKQVRDFLGLAGYCQKFFKNFA